MQEPYAGSVLSHHWSSILVGSSMNEDSASHAIKKICLILTPWIRLQERLSTDLKNTDKISFIPLSKAVLGKNNLNENFLVKFSLCLSCRVQLHTNTLMNKH
jgi:hypothetical protein